MLLAALDRPIAIPTSPNFIDHYPKPIWKLEPTPNTTSPKNLMNPNFFLCKTFGKVI